LFLHKSDGKRPASWGASDVTKIAKHWWISNFVPAYFAGLSFPPRSSSSLAPPTFTFLYTLASSTTCPQYVVENASPRQIFYWLKLCDRYFDAFIVRASRTKCEILQFDWNASVHPYTLSVDKKCGKVSPRDRAFVALPKYTPTHTRNALKCTTPPINR